MIRKNRDKKTISITEQHLFSFIYFRSQVCRSTIVGMVCHHQGSVFQFYRIRISSLAHTQNQLSLSSVHHCVKPSWVHSEWVQILFLSNISISSRKTFDTCINQISYSNPIRSFRFQRSSLCSPFFIYPLVLLFLLIIIIMAINVWQFGQYILNKLLL